MPHLALLALPVLLAFAQAPEAASELPPEVANWLGEAARLPADPSSATDADLAPLDALVGDAHLVLIGEATHGSREFFAFKARAFEHLVRSKGFRVFAMESGFADALDTERWLATGEGTLDEAMSGLNTLWRTEEYRALLQWMREWNADAPEGERLHLVGLDPQIHAGEAAARLQAWLERVDAETAADVAPVLRRLGALADLDAFDLEGLLEVVDGLRERAEPEEWAEQRQLLVVLRQRHRAVRLEGLEAYAFRDRCMADNARWILRRWPGARAVVSAHNGHVSRTGLFEVPGEQPVLSIGRALTADARDVPEEHLSLVVVGTAFGRGAFWSHPASGGALQAFEIDAPPAGSHEALLAAALPHPALLDLAGAPASGPLRDWLDQPRLHVGPGGAWDPAWLEQPGQNKSARLSAEYDALYFVPEVSAARRP